MNWFKQNVFATVLLVITLIGSGVLIFLSLQKKTETAATREDFETQKAEYQRLTTQPIFPNQKNLDALEQQRKQYEERANVLQSEIAKIQLPVEQISPSQFQDKLAAATRDIMVKAAANKVEIAEEDFFLGFKEYRSQLPPQAAVADLNIVLNSIVDVTNKLIDARISRLEKITRIPLPSEGGATAAPAGNQAPAANANAARGKNNKAEPRKVLDRSTFIVEFVGGATPVQNFLNTATSGPQLLTMQLVRLQNEQLKGPPRTLPGAPTDDQGAGVDPAPTEGTTEGAEAAPPINFILGEEKVIASVRFQIIRVVGDAAAKS